MRSKNNSCRAKIEKEARIPSWDNLFCKNVKLNFNNVKRPKIFKAIKKVNRIFYAAL